MSIGSKERAQEMRKALRKARKLDFVMCDYEYEIAAEHWTDEDQEEYEEDLARWFDAMEEAEKCSDKGLEING